MSYLSVCLCFGVSFIDGALADEDGAFVCDKPQFRCYIA
jgi:hypothetical protein